MAHGIEKFVKVAPAVWPGDSLNIQPGDLSFFAPLGAGGFPAPSCFHRASAAMVSAAMWTRRGVPPSGFHPRSAHPFSGSPITEAEGGTVYFGKRPARADVEAMLRLIGVHGHQTNYAAFLQESTSPEDHYLIQMRIVTDSALEFVFRTRDEPEGRALRQQSLPICDVIWRFIEWFTAENAAGRYSVDGALGGDGDCACESLAFGFMVENSSFGIYRIWTRAWLVTK